MPFEWLQMRISEENDRRKRESETLERLPRALDEVADAIKECVDTYRAAFGEESADMERSTDRLKILVPGVKEACVEVVAVAKIPGFQVDQGTGGDPLIIEVGLLPGDKLFFRDREKDQYVTMEEVTKRILDRAFFPKLIA